MNTTQSPELRDLIGVVQIDDVRLVESICRTQITADEAVPSQLLLQHGADVGSSMSGRFVVRANIVVRVIPDDKFSDEPPLGVEAILFAFTHDLTYLIPPSRDFSRETLTQFAELNGVFN